MTDMVRASGLRGYAMLMRQLGVDPAPLLRRQRITPAMLADDEALIPIRAAARLLESSAAAANCPDFGLRLANHQDISVLGPVAIAIRNEPTVASALDTASRYMFVHSPGMAMKVHAHSDFLQGASMVRFALDVPGQAVLRQTMDVCLGDIHHIVALLAGRRYVLRAVTLPHTPLASPLVYRRFYGAPVHFAQAHAALHIAPSTLAAGLEAVNDNLRQLAIEYLAQHFGDRAQTVTARVRHTLQRTLDTGRVSKNQVASLLGLHPRTLQRRLAAEGAGFEALRETVRQEAAMRYLSETQLPFGKIADMLGLPEQSVLSRNCRRWFGKTPSEIRRRAHSFVISR
jgi:AraC-like DNA-binding protein